ncbi:single-stranded DNA-binding protein [Ornithinicoccus halotolerans]|uniref:single-stranded DNA-binding protein n=1 Tax=Ornithinicoccus halotolerans TaxID=1748220 RepID=UPI001296CC78|nr:single-stranded DNA-binding protein [Ornithinicoccus halotolerans]
MTPRARTAQAGPAADRNEVHLTGRVSGAPVERELPSGDTVVSFRVVVTRSPGRGSRRTGDRTRDRAGGRPQQDTLDVACWSARTRASALRLPDGQRVELQGTLRRRFYRTPAGPASRYEVHAVRLRRL